MKLNKSKGRDQLNLKTISAEEMSIARFGECLDRSKVQKLQKYTKLQNDNWDAFNVTIKSAQDKVEVRTLDVKRLCNRLKGHGINLG